MQRVGSKLEDAAERARWRGGPEAELLHQRSLLGCNERLKLGVKGVKVGVILDGVERGVISRVALILPNVHCDTSVSVSEPMAAQ